MTDSFAYCNQHLNVHRIKDSKCWCGVVQGDLNEDPPMIFTTLLNAHTKEDAWDECRRRGLTLYNEDEARP